MSQPQRHNNPGRPGQQRQGRRVSPKNKGWLTCKQSQPISEAELYFTCSTPLGSLFCKIRDLPFMLVVQKQISQARHPLWCKQPPRAWKHEAACFTGCENSQPSLFSDRAMCECVCVFEIGGLVVHYKVKAWLQACYLQRSRPDRDLCRCTNFENAPKFVTREI